MAVSMIGPKFYAWDRGGKPLAGGLLYTYQARSNIPKPTYRSEDGIVENDNPVVLNDDGYADVYLDGSYKMVLKDKSGREIWTSDPVTDMTRRVSEWGEQYPAIQVNGTQFEVIGNMLDHFSVEQRLRIQDKTVLFGSITAVEYVNGNTRVYLKLDSGSLSNSLQYVAPSTLKSASSVPVLPEIRDTYEGIQQVVTGGETTSVVINGQTVPSISKSVADKFDAISAMVQGRLAYETLAELNADTGQAANTIAEVWNDTDDNNGVYGWDGSLWIKTAYDPKAYTDSVRNAAYGDTAAAQAITKDIDRVEEYVNREVPEADFRPFGAGWPASSGLRGWCGVFQVEVARRITDLQLRLSESANITNLYVRVIRRRVGSANTNAPGNNDSGDTILHDLTYDLTSHAGVATGDWENYPLGLSFVAVPGYYYFVEYTCDTTTTADAAMAAQAGVTKAPFTVASDSMMAGFYRSAGGGWIKYAPGGEKCIGVRVLTSEADVVALTDAGRNLAYTRKLREALGLDESAELAADSFNDVYLSSTRGWSAGDFFGWMTFRNFSEDTYVDALRAVLNNAYSVAAPNTPLNTTRVRIEIHEDDPGVMSAADFDESPQVFRRSYPVSLVAGGVEIEFPVGMTFRADKEYAIALMGTDEDGSRSGLGMAQGKNSGLPNGDRLMGGYQASIQQEGSWQVFTGATMPYVRTVSLKPFVTRARLEEITASMERVSEVAYERPWTGAGWSYAVGDGRFFDRWGVSYLPSEDVKVDSVMFVVDGLQSLSGFNFKVYRRDAGLNLDSQPGALSADEVILDRDYTNADIGATSDDWQELLLEVGEAGVFKKGYLYIFALDTTDYPGEGIGMGRSTDVSDQWQRGYYSLTGSANWTNLVTGGVNLRLNATRYRPRGTEQVTPTHTQVSVEGATSSGLTVTIDSLALKRLNLPYSASALSVTLAEPNKELGRTDSYTLTYDSETQLFYHNAAYLPYRFIRNVSVVRASDSTPLYEGVDWDAWFNGGKLRGVQNIADVTVNVTYDGYDSRYDLIEYDPFSGAISVKQGVSRSYDPEEYMPAPSADKRPLFLAYVYGDSVQLIPLYKWEYGVREGTEAESYRRQRHNQRALARVLGKLRSGQSVRIAGYGDSITAQGGGVPTEPNGTSRDVMGYYSAMPTDTTSQFTLYDHGDGGGAIHQHNGWNWVLKEHLENAYGVTVIYDNWGIGGTTSANSEDADTNIKHGGLWPARLNTMLASSPDLVVIAFGMNEIGSSATSANVAEIARQCQAAGADVIIVGCPRISSIGGRANVNAWRTTNDRLWQAAQETGSAFVSTTYIADDERLGGIAISPLSMCNANRYNHPGPYELRKYGEALSDLFV